MSYSWTNFFFDLLTIILSPASIRRFFHYSYIFLVPVLLNSLKYELNILNGKLIKLSIPGMSVLISGKNPTLDYIILDNWAFKKFMLADEPFAKTLWIFEIYVSVNNNLCRN